MKVIVYENENGGVSVVYPTAEALKKLGIKKIAAKDVPAGAKFKIIDAGKLPNDRANRSDWSMDMFI